MKIVKWTVYAAILIVIVFAGYLYYLGAFSGVTVTEKVVGPYQLAHKTHYGPYSKIGKVIDGVYSSLEAMGVKTTKGFGIYYDDPKKTPEKQLRSIGGCVIEPSDYGKLGLIKKSLDTSYLPKSRNVVAEFPYKGTPSIIISVMKVYPELNKYREQKGYKTAPVMELYDMPSGKIIYIMPIMK